ncbi:hypothetical protein [Rhodohalobacter sp.]|uniref:hypothetical protein n=1 Tax=Rhodohalobacter sp. TaxID=1974210 RepID=UPI003565D7A8
MTFSFDWGEDRAWLTNSHCTELGWEVNFDEEFYQPNAQENQQIIGNEVFDPFGCNCTVDGQQRDCRFSDAAVIEIPDGVNRNKGIFARTEYYGENWSSGSLEMTNEFKIRDYTDGSFTGNEVHKVGATSGWTKGEVKETCVDIPLLNRPEFASNDVVLLCQHIASGMRSDPGDSGSPVFRRNMAWQDPNEAALVGVLWGTLPSEEETYYSPMDGVLEDLEIEGHEFNILDYAPRPYLGHSINWSAGCDPNAHPRIFWDEIDEVNEYEIQRTSDGGISWVHVDFITHSDYTDFNICEDMMALDSDGDDYEVMHSYRVRSLSDDGVSSWSDIVHFGNDESDENGENGM